MPFSLAATFTDPAAKLNDLEARGMWGAVISPAPVLFGYDRPGEVAVAMCKATNQGMADFCGYAPGRYHWLANLPMQDPGDAAGMYAEAVRAGVVGAAIGTSVAGRRLDEPEFEVFWAQADAIGKPVSSIPRSTPPIPPWAGGTCRTPSATRWRRQSPSSGSCAPG